MISKEDIFKIKSQADFDALALDVFKFQFENNGVYRSFCDLLYKNPSDIKSVFEIPFLPIQFFKTHEVISSRGSIEKTFTSSGTTGSITSKHLVTDIKLYEESYLNAFKHFYGNIDDYVVLALLPSYLERDGSSLIYMVNDLIDKSQQPESGFYLNNLEELANTLNSLEARKQKTLLIGVSFALLDLVEQFQLHLKHTTVMETGGMKGRRKEIIRQELHQILQSGFGVEKIHSEYGMTELLSQAYSKGHGIFECPPWMKILTRDTEDALTLQEPNKTGGINIIDLANINSCSFIATQDLGRVYDNGQFEIIGRFDNSDIRGCNLMAL
ncbi:acyl-protein synthetase LuxE [Winogradskyella epiphytica]|uniref:Acyl-protein synthetase LuxE n=1 Tax=Winogradskyella epiphytica TaxID=262005 RepID=A0A2V4Y2A9_9FLAO|nr:acyl transferase [Winogradskyella epiphytica]PYE83004.1 acyl-protein synthetase LuxE [Winogradskyella epiphytica]GGW55111.1 acyltransferase [Winogradskyella epiphytica]